MKDNTKNSQKSYLASWLGNGSDERKLAARLIFIGEQRPNRVEALVKSVLTLCVVKAEVGAPFNAVELALLIVVVTRDLEDVPVRRAMCITISSVLSTLGIIKRGADNQMIWNLGPDEWDLLTALSPKTVDDVREYLKTLPVSSSSLLSHEIAMKSLFNTLTD
jgi:hypothetical protein